MIDEQPLPGGLKTVWLEHCVDIPLGRRDVIRQHRLQLMVLDVLGNVEDGKNCDADAL